MSTTEKSSLVGNATAMREALEQLYEQICHGETERNVVANRQMIRVALAAPPRNCDVGTADDWMSRFNIFCEHCSGSDCDHRLFKDEEECDCFARWLAMPCNEGETNEK